MWCMLDFDVRVDVFSKANCHTPYALTCLTEACHNLSHMSTHIGSCAHHECHAIDDVIGAELVAIAFASGQVVEFGV